MGDNQCLADFSAGARIGRMSVRCSDCDTVLPTGESPPPPCPSCGSDRRVVTASITNTIGITDSIEYVVSASNDAKARVRQFAGAIAALEIALDEHRVSETQDATKRALEALHELKDDLDVRQEWSQAGWDENAIGLWHGLLGARNAAHHQPVSIVTRHSGRPRDESLLWSIEPAVIATVHKERERVEYSARLDGKAVLPQLRQVLAQLMTGV
jgi:hypothetical protein